MDLMAASDLGLGGSVEDQLLSEEEKKRRLLQQQQQTLDPFGTRNLGKSQDRVAPGMPAAWQALGIR